MDTFPGSLILPRSRKPEAATKAILLVCAGAFTPSIEDRSEATEFLCGLDIAGTHSLFGPPEMLARTLLQRVRAVGIKACVAPGTAKGFIFISMEDETGIANGPLA